MLSRTKVEDLNRPRVVETKIVTKEEASSWVLPSFQRPLRINEKVRQLAEEIQDNGGVMPGGPFTLGKVKDDPTVYLIDGQHRREAFLLTDLKECLIDTRTLSFADYNDMAAEFVTLNSRLVSMRPDDILRGLEAHSPYLKKIREHCPFVGYGNVRRGEPNSALVSMSVLLRTWYHSSYDTIPTSGAGGSAQDLARDLEDAEVNKMIEFLRVAREAWQDFPQNYPLWAASNLTLAMWLWRRLVINPVREGNRAKPITAEQFKNCLVALSVDGSYMERLKGSTLRGARERSVMYNAMKTCFVKRLSQDTTEKVRLPSPPWAAS